jgi:hypothetical protein
MIYNYQQFIKENLNTNDELSSMVQTISERLPKEFYVVLDKHKNKLKGFVERFSADGVVDVDKIKATFGVNENIFTDAWTELKKLKYYLPFDFLLKVKDFFIGVWEFIVDGYVDGAIGKFGVLLKLFMIALTALLVGILIHLGVLLVDKGLNGLDQGVVASKITLVPAHTTTTTHYHKIGDVNIPQTVTTHHPDAWIFDVKGLGDDSTRVETWKTTSKELSNVNVGDTLDFENYFWDNTKEK